MITDVFTKYTLAVSTRDQQAETVLVNEWLCKFGIPAHIHSNQGRSIESALFQQFVSDGEVP